jgi:hypothetical protein
VIGRLHTIKCQPEQFWATVRHEKPFEWRRNDRGYQVGDKLRLELWDPGVQAPMPNVPGEFQIVGGYTKCPGCQEPIACIVTVTHIVHGGRFEIPVGFCIMGTSLDSVHLPIAVKEPEKGLAN